MLKFIRPILILTLMAAFAAGRVPAAEAALDLGKVDEYKLKSFSEYFGQYFDVAKVEFDDKEFEVKLREEAADINRWLADPANWPAESKIKPGMYADAGWLFSYFANAGLTGAEEHSILYLSKAAKADPKNYVIPLKLAKASARKGAAGRADTIRFAEQAVAADPAAAAKENLHYLLADAYYAGGEFAKAHAELKKQSEVNPEFENTSNLMFAWGMYIEKWGRVPVKIVFKKQPDGMVRPEPAAGV